MGRPKGGYYNKAGVRVPSTSKLSKIGADPGGIIHWAWQQGAGGLDYRETRDAAASAGTMVHQAVESWRHGRPYPWAGDPAIVEKARTGFGAFTEWASQTRLKIEETEVSLVSERYQYGGTFDCTLVNERRAMCDFKTSPALYPEHLIQVRAYGHLWDEHHPDQPLDGGYYVLRFNRDHGDFTHHWFAELDDAWAAFLLNRQIYDLQRKIKARC